MEESGLPTGAKCLDVSPDVHINSSPECRHVSASDLAVDSAGLQKGPSTSYHVKHCKFSNETDIFLVARLRSVDMSFAYLLAIVADCTCLQYMAAPQTLHRYPDHLVKL